MSDSGFLDALPAAMDAVGTARFEKHLADAIGSELDYDFITMARYSVEGKPCFLIHSHTFPSHMAELYLSQFVDADPYVEHWRTAEEPGVVWLQDIAFARKRYATYTDVFLPQIGVKDEIGVFLPAVGRDSVALFYNNRRGLFSPGDVRNLRQIFDVGAALYRVHIRALLQHEESSVTDGSPSLGSPPRLTSDTGGTIWFTNEWSAQQRPEIALVEGGDSGGETPDAYRSTLTAQHTARRLCHRQWIAGLGLTPRERDIVELTLNGHASASIAEVLALSVGNVKNHKRRIYGKLDIMSERDLFVRYIQAISLN
ncbi:helix-turn-helix transcriptional regulator [Roseovarius sp. Pro17]|uniref:helix-turn-helix domain-containing protein n=1 Tax=Roseovarius sp. Pro17 TaxID=3108175 RepID=UPI002D76D412|nr:helix-turn-helix transcriptional regulator [Roseovarius sp. Pro17]